MQISTKIDSDIPLLVFHCIGFFCIKILAHHTHFMRQFTNFYFFLVMVAKWIYLDSIVSCDHDDEFFDCQYQCDSVGDLVGLNMVAVDGIVNLSFIVHQYLKCPRGFYGPGCEQNCECSQRETCHIVKGCHIGKLVYLSATTIDWTIIIIAKSMTTTKGSAVAVYKVSALKNCDVFNHRAVLKLVWQWKWLSYGQNYWYVEEQVCFGDNCPH